VLLISLLWGLSGCVEAPLPVQEGVPVPVPDQPLRILWINSYGYGDVWASSAQAGFRESMARQGYSIPDLTLTLETHYLALTGHDSDAEVAAAVAAALDKISEFDPDAVIVYGDEAARLIIPQAADRERPIIFCGLRGSPREYGIQLPNVAGVLEYPRVKETLRVALAFLPDAEHYLVLGDTQAGGDHIARYVAEQAAQAQVFTEAPQLRVVSRWADWQAAVLEVGREVDFILLVRYQTLVDASGEPVPAEQVLRWTLYNSPVPVFGLWRDTVRTGAVGGLTLTAEAQGAHVARILNWQVEGVALSTILPEVPDRNSLAINLAAARHWELDIPTQFILAAEIYETLPRLEGGQ